MSRKLRAMCLAVLLLGSLAGVTLADPGPAKPATAPKKDSVDEQLRRSLDQDLLEGLGKVSPPGAASPGEPKPPGENTQPPSALDAKLLDDLGADGEAGDAEQDPLARIGASMRKAEKLLAGKNSSEPTQQLQQKIVQDLAALIRQLEEQAQQSQGGQKQTPRPATSARAAQQPGQNKPGSAPAGQPSNKPAAESTAELRPREAKPVQAAAVEHARRQAWGNLPDRLRQELQNAASEEFLPQYQEMIEDYFERLAETPPP